MLKLKHLTHVKMVFQKKNESDYGRFRCYQELENIQCHMEDP